MENESSYIPSYPLNTAVLFLTFNRLDTTEQVFQVIRKARPPRLYVASDGPRDNKPGEAEKIRKVRDYVLKHVDWECDVKTLFREKNWGCGRAVSSAITWFFENEEMGIILEDDCLPSQSFFWFCEELLVKYKDDERIMMICGTNFLNNSIQKGRPSYYFSKNAYVWGWASWRRAWKLYDFDVKTYPLFKYNKMINNYPLKLREKRHWDKSFEAVHKKQIDTWDFQLVYTLYINSGLSIVPNINLISNIGFNEDATHTQKKSSVSNLDIKNFNDEIRHPPFIVNDSEADLTVTKIFTQNLIISILSRIFRFGLNIIRFGYHLLKIRKKG